MRGVASRREKRDKKRYRRSDSQTEGLIYFNSLDCLEVDLKAECRSFQPIAAGALACLLDKHHGDFQYRYYKNSIAFCKGENQSASYCWCRHRPASAAREQQHSKHHGAKMRECRQKICTTSSTQIRFDASGRSSAHFDGISDDSTSSTTAARLVLAPERPYFSSNSPRWHLRPFFAESRVENMVSFRDASLTIIQAHVTYSNTLYHGIVFCIMLFESSAYIHNNWIYTLRSLPALHVPYIIYVSQNDKQVSPRQ